MWHPLVHLAAFRKFGFCALLDHMSIECGYASSHLGAEKWCIQLSGSLLAAFPKEHMSLLPLTLAWWAYELQMPFYGLLTLLQGQELLPVLWDSDAPLVLLSMHLSASSAKTRHWSLWRCCNVLPIEGAGLHDMALHICLFPWVCDRSKPLLCRLWTDILAAFLFAAGMEIPSCTHEMVEFGRGLFYNQNLSSWATWLEILSIFLIDTVSSCISYISMENRLT